MSRNTNVRFVKPKLEELESRVQPSFLLQGAVQQLVTPLNTVITDMQTAQTDLNTQFQAMVALGPSTASSTNRAMAQVDFGKAVGDWAHILVDQHAIQSTVTADLNFIRAAAFAEFAEGDPTDALVLTFGPIIGFNPTSALTGLVTQANSIANNSTVQTQINTDLFNITALDAHVTIAGSVQTPSF